MEKDRIFFGETGLTATSANHIANIAKEFITNTEQEMEAVQFYTTSINLIGQDKESVLHIGSDAEFVKLIPQKLALVAEAKSLIAWLREAIKAKERLTNEVKAFSLKEYCESHNIEQTKLPKREPELTEEEVIATYSIKDRNRFYALEAKAATIGKYIHPSGNYSEARKDLYKKLNSPKEVNGSGRDMVIRTFQPSVSAEEIDDVFFALQRLHRETQAELNAMKHKVELTIQQDAMEKQNIYNAEYQQYAAEQESLLNKLHRFKMEELKRVQALKIIIPNDLKDIYERMNKIGKDK